MSGCDHPVPAGDLDVSAGARGHEVPAGDHSVSAGCDYVPASCDAVRAGFHALSDAEHLLPHGADLVSEWWHDRMSGHADAVPVAGVGMPGCHLDGVPVACNALSDWRVLAALHHLRTDGLGHNGKAMMTAYVTI